MTLSEATELLAYLSRFDNRRPSAAASEAWSRALADVPLDADTKAAVDAFYGSIPLGGEGYQADRSRWMQPHHLRYHRQQIRKARADQAPPYTGVGGDVRQELVAARQHAAAAASGRLPPAPALPPPGDQPRFETTTRGAALVRAAARVPSRRPELNAPCPYCRAKAGAPCRNRRGPLGTVHDVRLRAAQDLADGRIPPSADQLAAEMEQRRAASAAALTTRKDPA
ncbi:hypothetical protein [Streptomyces sp. SID11385]|uniref:zinc finger domain-containing protein n=1 Tax=Streptomyces sp. SID11385 TaxID=2706031 RepID=UPI0013CA1332|nr:hypothetical protein [Streptomyces sp. SID11385]NEA42711.1 hypothetical protein [Streptomyces sp. SID11385]